VTENGHYVDWPPGSRVKYFGPRGGSIINIGSMASELNPPNLSIYTATKSALDAITRVLAKE
jgi:3-oxoacyl-[acyl-carrier protein] reductase